MGYKIITEEDFWICTEGAIPTQFQGTRETLHNPEGKKYITKEDKSTVGWLDFGCKKYMWLAALIAAVAVVVAVAIGVLTVATGGLGLIALGAIAGLVGGTFRDANGRLRNARGNPEGAQPGSFANDPRAKSTQPKNGKPYENGRPAHDSKLAEKVFESSKRNGKVFDTPGNEIEWTPGQPREGVWDLAHKPGYEYRHLYKAFVEGRITESQFLDYYNNPDFYYPENPSYNRSHIGELNESLYDFDN